MTSPPLRLAAACTVLLFAACPGAAPQTSGAEVGESTGALGTSSGTGDDGETGTCPIGQVGCACTGGGSCDPGLSCDDEHVCRSPDQPEDPTSTSAGPTGGSDDSSSGGGTTQPDDPSTGGAECEDPGDPAESAACMAIDQRRPFCGVDGTCVGCVDGAACEAATGGTRPLCQSAGDMAGACVACDSADALGAGQCSADAPHCDLDALVCAGCLEHSECPGTACDVASRTCFSPDRRLYVRRGPTMASPCTYDAPTGGTTDKPYCDIASAIAHAQSNGPTSDWTFVLMASDSSQDHGAFDVPGGNVPVRYAIVHELGSPLDKHTRFTALGPVVTVHDNVTLYIVNFGIYLKDNAFADSHLGVACMPGGSVWLDDSRVLFARGPGVRADSCSVHLRRSSIAFGKTEGVELSGGSLHLLNSFIDENGSTPAGGGGGIRMSDGAVADIVYSTLAANTNATLSGGDTVHCDGPASIKIRNSVIARGPDTGNASVVCPDGEVVVLDSVVDGDFGADGGNHKMAAESILMALDRDSITGAYRLVDPTMAEGKAIWQGGDPHDDYDKQIRNVGLGQPDYAGADLP